MNLVEVVVVFFKSIISTYFSTLFMHKLFSESIINYSQKLFAKKTVLKILLGGRRGVARDVLVIYLLIGSNHLEDAIITVSYPLSKRTVVQAIGQFW